ncbi:MAG: hypothetical protein AMXMBFR13_03010 [Phycisphaerae bacterium]
MAAVGLPASGQQPAPAASQGLNWPIIRTTPFAAIDQQNVRKWADARMDEILSAEEPIKAGSEFYRTLMQHFTAADATAEFKQGLPRILAEAFLPKYRTNLASPGRQPMGPFYILLTLNQFRTPAALPIFRLGLTDPVAASRSQAIGGLIDLLGIENAIPAQERQTIVQEIRKAAVAETNAAVLGQLYAYLAREGNTQARIVQDVVAILNDRLTRMEQQNEWPLVADAEAANWLASKYQAAPAPLQADIARQIARLMDQAVYSYRVLNPPADRREQLERIVLATESELVALYRVKVPNGTPPNPSVSETLLRGGPNRAQLMRESMDKWVGTQQTPGALNAPAAWGFPPGLGTRRPPPTPTTTTAPG